MVLPLLQGLLLEAFLMQTLNTTLTLLLTPLSTKCFATNCLPKLKARLYQLTLLFPFPHGCHTYSSSCQAVGILMTVTRFLVPCFLIFHLLCCISDTLYVEFFSLLFSQSQSHPFNYFHRRHSAIKGSTITSDLPFIDSYRFEFYGPCELNSSRSHLCENIIKFKYKISYKLLYSDCIENRKPND